MGNADANEEFFAAERARLVAKILHAIQGMEEPLSKGDVAQKIGEVALEFEKETYGEESR